MKKTIIVKKVDNFWVDENNNRWDENLFTEDEAIRASKELIDCHDCKNCSYCVCCTNCTHCHCCWDCHDCRICTNCRQTDRSKRCEDCSWCEDCISCTHCHSCKHIENAEFEKEVKK